MLPIAFAEVGETVVIRKITGDEKVRQRLAELGFVVDEEVTIMSASHGHLIVKVKESRIALGMDRANRILEAIMIQSAVMIRPIMESLPKRPPINLPISSPHMSDVSGERFLFSHLSTRRLQWRKSHRPTG